MDWITISAGLNSPGTTGPRDRRHVRVETAPGHGGARHGRAVLVAHPGREANRVADRGECCRPGVDRDRGRDGRWGRAGPVVIIAAGDERDEKETRHYGGPDFRGAP